MMNYKNILASLLAGETLDEAKSYELMKQIGEGVFSDIECTSLITAMSCRAISLHELMGFRRALLDLCRPFDIGGIDAIDLCGTGGDGKNSFNISTTSSFVVAASGYKVAKHGNYGVSSITGSSNLLESLGFEFSNDASVLLKSLDKYNLCFIHAPLFHPALKNVAHIRRSLGISTFFNMLGPLVNPARPTKQLVGVFSLTLARMYNYLLQEDNKAYAVVHSLDGYDEVSLTSDFQYLSNSGEKIISPTELGFPTNTPDSICGGENVEAARAIFLNVLQNKATEAQHNVVVANAALAIKCFEPKRSFTDCVSQANETIVSGKAYKLLSTMLG
ncbi:MAG: anthranilate phosphoribosyltransferase [Bacteroidales bacterium]